MLKTEQVKEVYFERVFNLGNYETFRIGLHATVEPKQTLEQLFDQLDECTVAMRNRHKAGVP
jgi:proteasome assembly chaperone (PAC2) family protein